MAWTPSPDNYLLGKGALYFDRFDSSGNSTGEFHLGNCPDFSLSIDISEKEHKSSLSGVATTDKKVLESIEVSVKFTLEEFVLENLLIAFLGEEGAINQTSGNISDHSITNVKKGRWYKLPHYKLSSGTVVVTNDDGSVTYVENTDYRVDYEVGRIYIIPDGSIVEGSEILVDYSYSDFDAKTIKALKDSKVVGFLRFIPAEDQVGPRQMCEIWKVELKPSGEIGFISDDWAKVEISGTIVPDYDNHPDEPYFRLVNLG